MHELMGYRLRPRPQSESGEELRARVTSHPQPSGCSYALHFQAQFVELDVRQLQVAQDPVMQAL